MASAVVVRNLGKRFRRFHRDRPHTLQEAVVRGLRGLRRVDTFWALRDVSFEVEEGRMLGILGANGAGKTTLLRLVGGVGTPDEGSVAVNGRLSGLFGLGVGFHPELTGRENVFVNGVICGLRRREVAARLPAIVRFAELESFIDTPLRTYSSGMQMRLAFAVAAHIESAVLLIDEVLAVGDLRFRRKCLERIQELRRSGGTVLLVSHDTRLVAELCDEALWLSSGRVRAHGPPDQVVEQYEAGMKGEEAVPLERARAESASIRAVRLLDRSGSPAGVLESGDPLRVEIDYVARERLDAAIFGVTLSSASGNTCFETSTEAAGLTVSLRPGGGRIALELGRLDLAGGSYFVDVGIYERGWTVVHDYHWRKYPFQVLGTEGEKGLLRPPHRWEVPDC